MEDEYILIENLLFTLDATDKVTSDGDIISYQWVNPSGNTHPDSLGGNTPKLNLFGTESDSGSWTLEVSNEGGTSTHIFNLIYKRDADGDEHYDEIDAFPNDPNEWLDTDGDGVGDNTDRYPNYDDTIILNFIFEYISNHNYLQLDEIKDLRPGSAMIEIHNGQATLTMEVEQSDDLNIWTNDEASTIQIPIDAETEKKFFRFKMAE